MNPIHQGFFNEEVKQTEEIKLREENKEAVKPSDVLISIQEEEGKGIGNMNLKETKGMPNVESGKNSINSLKQKFYKPNVNEEIKNMDPDAFEVSEPMESIEELQPKMTMKLDPIHLAQESLEEDEFEGGNAIKYISEDYKNNNSDEKDCKNKNNRK